MEDLPSTSKDDAFKIIPSQRGGYILMRNGYRYTLRRINLNGHKVWRCVNRKICTKIPKYDNIKKTLYKHRHKQLQTTKTRFTKLKSIVVPGKFKPFLLADFLEKKCRILLFATPEAKETLRQAKHVFLCYALLPDKKHHTYTVLFELIKSQIPEFAPETFTTDYEVSAMTAITTVFPNAILLGCLFHFIRALWRKADQLTIKKSKIMRAHVKRCIALAFLPKEYVQDGWLYVPGIRIGCTYEPRNKHVSW
ncbi:hypothetical protein ABMA27_002416 [Loxostege sticticalis]|uniref:MULE transposase domain-containing protein n=1 Tax=Loxostege sticticalis TaxID=481309 RepID=A0ABR3HTK0_LOXSC